MASDKTVPASQDRLIESAKIARAELERLADPDQPLTMLVSQDDEQHELKLPAEAVALLMQMLEHLALHKHVAVVASDKLLTTQQVADILRVSRPFITKLIDTGELPCEMRGTHRRIRYDDVIAYKRRIDGERALALDELVGQAQKDGLGY